MNRLTEQEVSTLPPRDQVEEHVKNLIHRLQEEIRVVSRKKAPIHEKTAPVRALRKQIASLYILIRHLPSVLTPEDLETLDCGHAPESSSDFE